MKVVLPVSVPLDALPYVDGYNEQMKRQVDRLVQDEMRRFTPPDYLAQLPAPAQNSFKDSLLEAEFARLASGGQMAKLDITRYKVEGPAQHLRGDPVAWQHACNNAMAQLEHQYLRLTNLELLNNYGGNMWRIHNSQVDEVQRNITKVLDQYKKEIEDINRQRKSEQEAAGLKINVLSNKWEELIYKNYEIETACVALEQELALIKAKLPPSDSSNPSTSSTSSSADQMQ